MLYVVLGMHKSGTTLVAEILHRSGVRMVEEGVTDLNYDTGNKYERLATQRLNKDILKCHDMESYEITLPSPLVVTDAQHREMEEIARAANATGEDWGFKDPRTCLTYRSWKPSLPTHRLIIVYRHPSAVYAHYRRQTGMLTPWRALQSWSLHNRQILDILSGVAVSTLVVSYERLMSEQAEFHRLATFVGRPLVDARRPGLNRKKPGSGAKLMLVDRLVGLMGDDRPLGILRKLETLRQGQIPGSFSRA